MAEYELIHKPGPVIALDESVVEEDADWVKLESDRNDMHENCQMEARRLYSDILTAGPAAVAV